MTARITASLRERAAQICSMMACHRAASLQYQNAGNSKGALAVYNTTSEMDLAWEAWRGAARVMYKEALEVRWAECEAMLRTGWTP